MTRDTVLLKVQDIYKDFSGLEILKGVTFDVENNGRHAVIGPNGAGKTTLFNIITGKYKPSSGTIQFKGEDITSKPPNVLSQKGISKSFQITNVFQNLTVFENVQAGVRSRHGLKYNFFKRPDKNATINQKTEVILEMVGLADVRDSSVRSLSYGRQRALELGITLSTEPELILLDEPTAGMTREETLEAVKLIDRVTTGKTLVIIEHDMDVVFTLANRVSVLHYGTIIASGKPDTIKNDQRVKDAYLGEDE